MASKTRCRGASNRRVMTISRSDGVVTVKVLLFATLLTAMFLLLLFRFQFLEVTLEAIEPPFPDLAIALGPVGHFLQRAGFEPARAPLRFAAARDESRPLEHTQMLRDGGQAHVERRGELAHRALTRHELRQNRAACRVGQGGKREAQRGAGHLYLTNWLINLLV